MKLKPVPGTLGFLADSRGNIYNSERVKVEPEKDSQGYLTVRVQTVDEQWVSFPVERLVAFTFFDLPKPGYELVLHLDADPSNNEVDNLEWASEAERKLHKAIFGKEPLISGFDTSHAPNKDRPEYHHYHYSFSGRSFKTLDELMDYSGLEIKEIWESIRDGKWVDHEQWKIRYYSSSPEMQEIERGLEDSDVEVGHNEMVNVPERAVKARDIDTGIITLFPTMSLAAAHFRMRVSQIYQLLPKNGEVKIFRNKYQLVNADERFPEPNELDIRHAKYSGPKDVVAYSHSTDCFHFFDSVDSFVERTKLNKETMQEVLRDNNLERFGDWTALYYEGENFKQLVEHVKGSSPGVIVSTF